MAERKKRMLDLLTDPGALLGRPGSASGQRASECQPFTWYQAIRHFERRGLGYELAERVAILEVDGGLTHDEAQTQAASEMMQRHKQVF